MFRIISWFIIFFACFYGIGSYPLLDNNEGMYATIARDMLKSGQFIIPNFGGIPYLEKPPMLYWLMAGSMSLFGINEWAAHLIPAAAFFLTAGLIQRFTFRVTGSEAAGFAAAIMLVTSLPMLVWGRQVLCDMVMTCFFSAALFQFYGWYTNRNKRRLLGFYAFLALAVLTKGLLPLILAGGVILVFLLWQREPLQGYFKILSPLGILLFFFIAAPWHIAASIQHPGFAWFYFINEHLLRFLNKREPHDYHTGPFWYYLPRILIYLMPWTLFLLIFTRKPKPSSSPYPVLARFLWSWFFFCLVFFSIGGSKANYYMIAGMPALVILVALHIKTYMDLGDRAARSLTAGGLSLILVILWFVHFFCSESNGDLFATCQDVSWPYIIGSGMYCFAAIALCWRIPQRWLAPLLGSHILLVLPLLIAGVTIVSEKISQKTVAESLKASYGNNVVIYQEFENLSALAFYLERQPVIVDSHSDDLLYGQHQPSGKPYFMSLDEWIAHKPYLPMVVFKKSLDNTMYRLYTMHVDLQGVCILHRFEQVAIISMCDHVH